MCSRYFEQALESRVELATSILFHKIFVWTKSEIYLEYFIVSLLHWPGFQSAADRSTRGPEDSPMPHAAIILQIRSIVISIERQTFHGRRNLFKVQAIIDYRIDGNKSRDQLYPLTRRKLVTFRYIIHSFYFLWSNIIPLCRFILYFP